MHLMVWVFLILGGVVNQSGMALLGFDWSVRTVVDAAYWGGGALLLHWYLTTHRSV